MSSGKTHAVSTVLFAGATGPLIILSGGQPVEYALAFMGGCLAGLVINPDLDVDHGSKSNAIMRESAGCVVSAAWRVFWWPYACLIPHRSPLSHFPLLGTALRIAYLLAVPALIWWVLGYWISLPDLTYPSLTPFWLWAIAGLAAADGMHALLDFR